MSTPSMIPYSNPGGNNQFGLNQGKTQNGISPIVTSATGPGMGTGMIPTSNPVSPTPVAAQNPFVPITPTSVTGGAGVSAPQQQWDGSYATNVAPTVPGGVVSNNTLKQFTDIYGQGTGASLFNLLNNMSGVDSTTLQEFIQSLVPSEAKGQANINASLGAAGVGANSSVAGIADANLQAQEFGAISQEAAGLTQSQEDLSAQILESTMPSAQKEVSTSNWDIFSNVLKGVEQFGTSVAENLAMF
jgi:hypothetical protein